MSYIPDAFDRVDINYLVDDFLDQMEMDVMDIVKIRSDEDWQNKRIPLMTYLMKRLNIAASERGYNSLVSNGKNNSKKVK